MDRLVGWPSNGERSAVLKYKLRANPVTGPAIIRELIPFELGGTVELAFASDGVRCRMEIPAEWVR